MNKQIRLLSAAVDSHERNLKAKIECCQALQKCIGQIRKLKGAKAPLVELELQYHLATLDWEVHGATGGKYEGDVGRIQELVVQILKPEEQPDKQGGANTITDPIKETLAGIFTSK